MKNRKEYKVAVFQEEVQFLTYNSRKPTPSIAFSKPPHHKLLQFAYDAVQDLKNSCPEFLCDGLVRVDIFQNEAGNMVVNEFESLEANYYTSNHIDMVFMQKLITYWEVRLVNYTSLVEESVINLEKNK